jgi:predicted aldo/keto reductase-like oxidoreductase
MFISVKNLTYGIDITIAYVEEAKEYHSCSESEYNQYLEKMYRKLDNMVKKLKQVSSNKKLISKYEKKVEEIKW